MTDNIYLRCSVIIVLCATTFAAPGGFGSFAGSSASSFSSASSNAQAGSVASAISSANAFTGGTFPTKNPDGTSHGLNHQHGISVGTGSYVGTGGIYPGSDKFGSSHQGSGGIKGGHNHHKSQIPCSQCQHIKEKWEYDNYDEQLEEKEEETHGEEDEQDDCDDGQYKPEHHYRHDISGDAEEHEEETVPGVHKIENTGQYNYDQENDKGSYTPSDNKEHGNNNYGNTGLVGADNQNKNNNNGDYQHSTKYPFTHTNAGISKDFSHLSVNPSDFNKKKENDNKNLGTPGVVAPISGIGSNYGNTNKGPFGSVTPSQTNLGSVSGTNAGCSNSGSGGGCSISGTDSNLNQGPVKIGQTHLTKGTNEPSLTTGTNIGNTGCNSLYGNCDNGKTNGPGQYHPKPVGSGHNLQGGYTSGVSNGNKPHSYDQQHTGQPNTGNLPSGPRGNVGVGSGCAPGSPSSAYEGTPLQKNIPISTQTYGTVGSGLGHVGAGKKPIPTQIPGTFGSGSSNVGFGNKPHSYDQQQTEQTNKGNLPSGPGGNVGVGSGCAPGSPSSACSDEGTPLEKNLPVSTQTYGTAGSGPGYVGGGSTPIQGQTHGGSFASGSSNVGVGNKPHSYNQHNIGQPSINNLPSGPSGIVGAGSGSTSGVPSAPCDDEGTSVQKNVPLSSDAFGSAGSGSGFNVNGQSGYGNQNSYQFNTGNPFLHGGQSDFNSHTFSTSSPFSNSLSTTVKPIGLGNPFLDGTVSNTFGSQHPTNNKHNIGITPITNDVPNKPIGVGNPFLSNGSGGSSSFGTVIHPGVNVESISSTSAPSSEPLTVKPIGHNNPFFGTLSGNSVNKYSGGLDSNKNTPFGSGSSNPSSSEDQSLNQFSKSKQIPGVPGVIGISSSGTNLNTNQGVKGGQHHNPTFGSVATSNSGTFSTGFNTPNAYNNNNNAGSLIGTANIKKPSYTLLNSPGTSSQTSGSDNSANGNKNSLSNSLNNGNNPNGQFNSQVANAGAQSFAGASAGSYAGSFSSSQASSGSSSFASSKSGSYSANGDPNILHQLNGNWPFDMARSLDGISSGWPSLNAGSQASAFSSSNAGSWSKPRLIGVKSR
ncbi:hypothetical protein M0802_000132 [Mischocyttarus mexicanus]|nr:hypothetical protein M0802_000132 [Mischocyttarus mexicanus]